MTIILDTQQLRELVDEARSMMRIALVETSEECERLNRADEAKVNAKLLLFFRHKLPDQRRNIPDQLR